MKKIKMFCDPFVAAVGISFSISYSLLVVWIVFLCVLSKPPLWILVFLAVGYVVLIIATIKAVPQALSFVELDSEGVSLKIIFKKTHKIPYEKFKFFRVVYYTHIYKKRYFIVMGISPVPMSDLAYANKLRNSGDLIKIKLTKKVITNFVKYYPNGIRINWKTYWKEANQKLLLMRKCF